MNDYTVKAVLVRYGELFLKSEPVKRHFISVLIGNMDRSLTASGLPHTFEVHRGRILIHGDNLLEIARVASRTFGVVDSAVCQVTEPSPGALAAAAVRLAEGRIGPGTRFAVRARREGKAGPDSQEIAAAVGSEVSAAIPGVRVDLSAPEYEIHVELRSFGGIVYDRSLPGPGGLPGGVQGKVVGLLSAGIDSPVASWLMMRRGCELVHLHLSGGRWSGRAVERIALGNHRQLSLWAPAVPLRMLIGNCESLYDAMEGTVEPRLRCVVCKRFMLRVGSDVAAREEALGLVTGDNLGQVASQTLRNLSVIDRASAVVVYRPLLTYDKEEIVTRARQIGTFVPAPGDLACRAVPRQPATGAEMEQVLEAEKACGIGKLAEEVVAGLREAVACCGTLIP
jgi:thiamine biosynthesis protein ThiI